MEFPQTLKDIEDHLMLGLQLDVIERSIYYHLLRHTRVIGKESGLFALVPLAKAVGISEFSARERIRSMDKKGCIKILERNKNGHLVKVLLPSEIDGLIPSSNQTSPLDINTIDFYNERTYVKALVARENSCCFYCLRNITTETCVLDHVIPRVVALDNSYRNIVASCHECNALKQGQDPTEFIRSLYRRSILSETEFQGRLANLEKLQSGQLVPDII